jgi:hypothetical protein
MRPPIAVSVYMDSIKAFLRKLERDGQTMSCHHGYGIYACTTLP